MKHSLLSLMIPLSTSLLTTACGGLHVALFGATPSGNPITAGPINGCDPNGAIYGGGDGSTTTPYLICTPAHLLRISQNLDKNFNIVTDLDFSTTAFTPIGDSDANPFLGTLDGQNHKVAHLAYINATDANSVGLFRMLGANSTVKNLNLQIDLFDGNNIVGGVAGSSLHATFANITVAANLRSNATVGGVVGEAKDSPIATDITTSGNYYSRATGSRIFIDGSPGQDDCGAGGIFGATHYSAGVPAPGPVLTRVKSSANVTWEANTPQTAHLDWMHTGGIIGYSYNLTCDHCEFTGIATGRWNVGGLTGQLDNGKSPYVGSKITNSRVSGSVVGQTNVGGLVSLSYNLNISNSSFSGTVTGDDLVGGIVGGGCGVSVQTSFAIADVKGATRLGGIIGGMCFNTISDSYALGSVTITSDASGGDYYGAAGAGGSGYQGCAFQNSYASVKMSNPNGGFSKAFGDYHCTPSTANIFFRASIANAPDDHAISLDDSQMVTASTYTGFDFTSTWVMPLVNPMNDILSPVLKWQCGVDGIVCP